MGKHFESYGNVDERASTFSIYIWKLVPGLLRGKFHEVPVRNQKNMNCFFLPFNSITTWSALLLSAKVFAQM